jgi:hypothetical protein
MAHNTTALQRPGISPARYAEPRSHNLGRGFCIARITALISVAAMSLHKRTRPGLGIIEPCLPSRAKATPSGSCWIHEIEHVGFRIPARRDAVVVRAA